MDGLDHSLQCAVIALCDVKNANPNAKLEIHELREAVRCASTISHKLSVANMLGRLLLIYDHKVLGHYMLETYRPKPKRRNLEPLTLPQS